MVTLEQLATYGEPTGFHDRHGLPIYRGDLIRVPHYIHRRCRRQMWLYFRVKRLDGSWVVQNWDNLDSDNWQCLLKDCCIEGAEVLAESGLHKNDRGEIITFNERLRLAAAQYQQER